MSSVFRVRFWKVEKPLKDHREITEQNCYNLPIQHAVHNFGKIVDSQYRNIDKSEFLFWFNYRGLHGARSGRSGFERMHRVEKHTFQELFIKGMCQCHL